MSQLLDSVQLPATVSSTQDLQSLIMEVRQFAKWQAQANTKIQLALPPNVDAPIVSPAAADLIATASNLDDLVADLQEYRDTAPQITITLAAPAGGEFKRTLVTWCRDNIEPNMLVSFQFNKTILGGMVVRYGSRIFDWSFRRQLIGSSTSGSDVPNFSDILLKL